jgi:hypothetical protein
MERWEDTVVEHMNETLLSSYDGVFHYSKTWMPISTGFGGRERSYSAHKVEKEDHRA